jgi:hypothetical protein
VVSDFRRGLTCRPARSCGEQIEEGKETSETTWADVERTLEFYAKRLRKRMDAARGK